MGLAQARPNYPTTALATSIVVIVCYNSEFPLYDSFL